MPKVPTYQPDQVELGGLRTPTMGTPDVSSAGKEIARGVASLGQLGMKMYEESENIDVQSKVNEYAIANDQIVGEYQSLTGEQAAKSVDDYRGKLKETHEKVGSSLTGRARQKFELATAKMNGLSLNSMSRHAVEQERVWGVNTNANASVMSYRKAESSNSVQAFEVMEKEGHDYLAKSYSLAGKTPEELKVAQTAASEAAAINAIKARIRARDPNGANIYIETLGGRVTPDTLEALKEDAKRVEDDINSTDQAQVIFDTAQGADKQLSAAKGNYEFIEKSLMEQVKAIKDPEERARVGSKAAQLLKEAKAQTDANLNEYTRAMINKVDTNTLTDADRSTMLTVLDDHRLKQVNAYINGERGIDDNRYINNIDMRIRSATTPDELRTLQAEIDANFMKFSNATRGAVVERLNSRGVEIGKEMVSDRDFTKAEFISTTKANADRLIESMYTKDTVRDFAKVQVANILARYANQKDQDFSAKSQQAFIDDFVIKKKYTSLSGAEVEVSGFAEEAAVSGALYEGDAEKAQKLESELFPQEVTSRNKEFQSIWSLPASSPMAQFIKADMLKMSRSDRMADQAEVLSVLDDAYGASVMRDVRSRITSDKKGRRPTTYELTKAMLDYHEVESRKTSNVPYRPLPFVLDMVK